METSKLVVSVPFLVTKYLKQLKRGFFGGLTILGTTAHL